MAIHWRNGIPNTVFISGGGSGIGEQFAVRMAQQGANVAIFNRKLSPQVVDKLRQQSANSTQRFQDYSADVSDMAGLQIAIDKAVVEVGKPDLAINSAGIQLAGAFEIATAADFDQVIQVNLIGTRNFSAALMPHLHSGSQLVLVASLAGLVGNYGYAAYCASKHGVIGLAKVLRIELKLQGIDVSICCPGEVETPMVAKERETIHPISEALRAFAGQLQVEPACEQMLAGIAKRQFEIIPGFKPRLVGRLFRWIPGLMDKNIDSMAAAAAKQMAQH